MEVYKLQADDRLRKEWVGSELLPCILLFRQKILAAVTRAGKKKVHRYRGIKRRL